jgi:uncharacterized protein (TIGR03067 family)
MSRSWFILSACLLSGCGVSHAAPQADDARAWQGTWRLVSCVANGETQKGNMKWIVAGDRYTIWVDGKSGGDPYTFKLDPRQKHIDVFHHDTPKGTYGGQLKGIYDLQGNVLKVCYDGKGQRYPTSFDAGRGSGQLLYHFERE